MTEKDSKAYMYVVECADGTLYTAILQTSNAASKPTTQAKAPSIPELAYQLNSSTQKLSPANQRP